MQPKRFESLKDMFYLGSTIGMVGLDLKLNEGWV